MVFTLPGARVNYPGQGTAYIALPPKGKRPLPVVLAIHGSGRSAVDYRDTPFYIRQRRIAAEYSCLFAAVSNGPDAWGTDDGLHNVLLLLDYVKSHYETAPKVLLWATSAGGALAHRLVQSRPNEVAAVIGTFPVYDLTEEFSILPLCGQAWCADTRQAFLQKTAGKNAPDFAKSLKATPYFIAHGDRDALVPLEKNSMALARDCGENIRLEVIPGGEHSSQDMRYLDHTPATGLAYYLRSLL